MSSSLSANASVTVRPAEAPFDAHTMMQLPRQRALDAASLALDGIQNLSPEEQVLGAAVLFALLSERVRVNPQSLYQTGLKVIGAEEQFHKRTNDAAQSLRDYASLRIRGERHVSIS